jgi:predicted transcriptional regulator
MADELREKPITVMCEPSLRERAEKVAGDMDRSLSWVGNRALEEFVERHEKKGKR